MASFPTLAPSNRRHQRLLFFVSIGLLLVAGVSVIGLLATAWGQRPWSIARHTLRGGMNAVGVAPTFFYYIPLGVFIGLAVGLLLDSFKYVQGVIVAGAALIAVPVVFIPRGVFIEPLALSFGPNTVLTALLFAAVTLRAGGVTFESLDAGKREYPRIPALIFWLAAALAVFGLVEAHVAYNSPIVAVEGGITTQPFSFEGIVGANAPSHLVGVIVLLPALRYFTTYERGMNVIMLGPKRSGKSAVFGGIHLYIRDNVDEQSAAANRVNRLRQSIESKQFPDPTPSTLQSGSGGSQGAQPTLLELPYSWGRFVPTRVRFSVVDYPGEALEDILAEVMEKATQQVQGGDAEIATDGGDRDEPYNIPFSDDDEDPESESESSDDSDGQWEPDFANSGDTNGTAQPRNAGGTDAVQSDDVGGTTSSQSEPQSGDSGVSTGGSAYDGSGSDAPFGSRSDGFGDGSDASIFDGTEDESDDSGLFMADPKSSWEAATRTVREATNLSEMIPGIRGCIHNADRIVLTLPLDDFVAPVIERGNVPAYLQDRVITPEEIDDYRRTEFRPIKYNGLTYGVKGPNRDDTTDYLQWYEGIRAIYPEKDIVIVGTMADWMLEDFKANRESSTAPQADGYREFCDYVRDEIVRAQMPAVNQVFGGRTDPDPMYLLWYDIANEDPAGTDELRIDVSGPSSVLKGARQFMQRINQ